MLTPWGLMLEAVMAYVLLRDLYLYPEGRKMRRRWNGYFPLMRLLCVLNGLIIWLSRVGKWRYLLFWMQRWKFIPFTPSWKKEAENGGGGGNHQSWVYCLIGKKLKAVHVCIHLVIDCNGTLKWGWDKCYIGLWGEELFRTTRWDVHECFITDRLAWVPLNTNACSLSTGHPYSKVERKQLPSVTQPLFSKPQWRGRVSGCLHDFIFRWEMMSCGFCCRLVCFGLVWVALTQIWSGEKKAALCLKSTPHMWWSVLIEQLLQSYISLWGDVINHNKYLCSSSVVFLIVTSSVPLLSDLPTPPPCQYGFWGKNWDM